ncbi:hypothetical protein ACVOMV_24350 [Mesorhizobium atlanticum]
MAAQLLGALGEQHHGALGAVDDRDDDGRVPQRLDVLEPGVIRIEAMIAEILARGGRGLRGEPAPGNPRSKTGPASPASIMRLAVSVSRPA